MLLELENLLFDGISGNQAVGEDLILLANTVGAINGLCLVGWVSPGVQQDYVFRGGEI